MHQRERERERDYQATMMMVTETITAAPMTAPTTGPMIFSSSSSGTGPMSFSSSSSSVSFDAVVSSGQDSQHTEIQDILSWKQTLGHN